MTGVIAKFYGEPASRRPGSPSVDRVIRDHLLYARDGPDDRRRFTDLMIAVASKREAESELGESVAEQGEGRAGRAVLNRSRAEPEKRMRDLAAELIRPALPGERPPALHRLLGLARATLKNRRTSAEPSAASPGGTITGTESRGGSDATV